MEISAVGIICNSEKLYQTLTALESYMFCYSRMQFPGYPARCLDRHGKLLHASQDIWINLEVWLCHPVFQDANYASHPMS
jgi:hypothetical protein